MGGGCDLPVAERNPSPTSWNCGKFRSGVTVPAFQVSFSTGNVAGVSVWGSVWSTSETSEIHSACPAVHHWTKNLLTGGAIKRLNKFAQFRCRMSMTSQYWPESHWFLHYPIVGGTLLFFEEVLPHANGLWSRWNSAIESRVRRSLSWSRLGPLRALYTFNPHFPTTD